MASRRSKLLCVMFVAGSAALITCSAHGAPPAGDVNHSGTVDALDVQLVINGVLGIAPHASQDVNFDTRINALDVQLVVNAVLGISIDADGDGLADAAETLLGTDRLVADTDDDGLIDLEEAQSGSDPLVAENGVEVFLDLFTVGASALEEGVVREALEHLRQRVMALGGRDILLPATGARPRTVEVGTIKSNDALASYFHDALIQNASLGWQAFQKEQGYFLGLNSAGGVTQLCAGGLSPLGVVYALSELELRLRLRDGRVMVAFPEWRLQSVPSPIIDKPAIEERGEYINVGYDIPEITPHRWSPEKCDAYIDKLVLAKLNRVYFYVWTNAYSLYPGSVNAQDEVSQSVHANVKRMIERAHERGLEAVYMYCPTFFPKDVWDAHPEMHAVIEYVDWGFPAACPSAPGSWDLMKDIARAQFDWFKAADAVQLWFYDPGGCWCDRFGDTGCYRDQATILARQVKEFGDLFREYNPNGKVEYNLWPIWLWEQIKGISYRQNLAEKIKEAFNQEAAEVTAVGAIDNDITRPLLERDLGFRTGVFVFGTNPETGYVFPTPHLRWMADYLSTIPSRQLNGAFTHRLEAWSRYPGTYISSRLMWEPATPSPVVLREFSEWQTADVAKGELLAQALSKLDHLTDKGATPAESGQMLALLEQAMANLPEACAADLEYLPATFRAIDAIARAIGVNDPTALDSLASEFQQALATSPTYGALVPNARIFFDRYRGFLAKGFEAENF